MNVRTGLTLIELLVVVAILVVLVGVTTAIMQPALADREAREAARQVNEFIAGQMAQAAFSERPTGVLLERQADNTTSTIWAVESPPVYAGDSTQATATLGIGSLNSQVVGLALLHQSPTAIVLVEPGDRIRFDFKGPWYDVLRVQDAGGLVEVAFDFDNPRPPLIDDPSNNPPVPFQVLRQPQKAGAKPLQLPAGMVVDLSQSGLELAGTEFAAGPEPVMIVFDRTGWIDRVWATWGGTYGPRRVLGGLHLLIGRRDQAGIENLQDGRNRWISVYSNSGGVYTNEVKPASDVATAREFVYSGGEGGD